MYALKMTDKFWLACATVLCLAAGFAKITRPQAFLDFRRRHPWIDRLDFYAFIFKSRYAERIVKMNGYVLLLIGVGLALRLFF